jgi:tRNA threonylcarbamoyladenosine biosynthesis protein TsaB
MILCLETATKNCSVSLLHEGEVLGSRSEHGQKFVHGERLHLLIKEVLDEQGIAVGDLDAVCVGKGPGSYTGLRIGVSTAKGLCYASNVPLWSVPTLGCFNQEVFGTNEDSIVISVIDARRDEVFAQVWKQGKGHWSPVTEVTSVIVDADSFVPWRELGATIVGDCTSKVQKLLGANASHFRFMEDAFPDAKFMKALLDSEQEQSEDVAYFEPFYLKDFVAEKSKKKWL